MFLNGLLRKISTCLYVVMYLDFVLWATVLYLQPLLVSCVHVPVKLFSFQQCFLMFGRKTLYCSIPLLSHGYRGVINYVKNRAQ